MWPRAFEFSGTLENVGRKLDMGVPAVEGDPGHPYSLGKANLCTSRPEDGLRLRKGRHGAPDTLEPYKTQELT